MTIVEVSAIYVADREGFHLDDKAKAIFEAHGGKWVDANTDYGGPTHLARTITYQMPVEQVGAVKLALELAGFRVLDIDTLTVDALLKMFDRPYSREAIGEADWNFRRDILILILDYAAGFYDDHDARNYEFALAVAAHVLYQSSD
jgi:hypothetical protein